MRLIADCTQSVVQRRFSVVVFAIWRSVGRTTCSVNSPFIIVVPTPHPEESTTVNETVKLRRTHAGVNRGHVLGHKYTILFARAERASIPSMSSPGPARQSGGDFSMCAENVDGRFSSPGLRANARPDPGLYVRRHQRTPDVQPLYSGAHAGRHQWRPYVPPRHPGAHAARLQRTPNVQPVHLHAGAYAGDHSRRSNFQPVHATTDAAVHAAAHSRRARSSHFQPVHATADADRCVHPWSFLLPCRPTRYFGTKLVVLCSPARLISFLHVASSFVPARSLCDPRFDPMCLLTPPFPPHRLYVRGRFLGHFKEGAARASTPTAPNRSSWTPIWVASGCEVAIYWCSFRDSPQEPPQRLGFPKKNGFDADRSVD